MHHHDDNNTAVTLSIQGMHCASCATNIEKKLNNSEGINTATVNFSNEKSHILYDASKVNEQQLVKIVE